jgi:hypothetical protein
MPALPAFVRACFSVESRAQKKIIQIAGRQKKRQEIDVENSHDAIGLQLAPSMYFISFFIFYLIYFLHMAPLIIGTQQGT